MDSDRRKKILDAALGYLARRSHTPSNGLLRRLQNLELAASKVVCGVQTQIGRHGCTSLDTAKTGSRTSSMLVPLVTG